MINRTLKFNSYETSDVSLLFTIDKNTLDKNNYSVVDKKDIFDLNKLSINNYCWTEDLSLDDFILNYNSYLLNDFKYDLLKLQEKIITAENFCSVYVIQLLEVHLNIGIINFMLNF